MTRDSREGLGPDVLSEADSPRLTYEDLRDPQEKGSPVPGTSGTNRRRVSHSQNGSGNRTQENEGRTMVGGQATAGRIQRPGFTTAGTRDRLSGGGPLRRDTSNLQTHTCPAGLLVEASLHLLCLSFVSPLDGAKRQQSSGSRPASRRVT